LIRPAVLAPLVVVALLIALFALNIGRDPTLVPSALIGSKAPDFSLPALETADVPGFSTADLSGRVSVVNVFASWCVPCRAEHPLLMRLAARDDVNLFGINYNDAPENAGAFLTSLGNPYDRIGADRDRRVSIDFGVYGVPETFVIDADGVITFKVTGPMSPEIFETELLPAIEAAKS
jgi:cytochrome c biogenesis protein CcmG/thiol:disulfide interchange protein DsbE